MAITYGFYNSMNGDRKYDAVQLSSIFDGVIRDGVFQSIGGYLATKPGTGMQVIVAPGKAWFDHTWTVNDADLPLDISQSDVTLSRYDAVILETDSTKSVRENSIKVLKGTPASSPQKPTLTNEGDVHQHPLAYILVPGGSTEIQAQNIDIMVGKTECPFVTSILESVSIEALLEKWEGEFRVWFDDLQEQMSGDVATNLQNQITKIDSRPGDIINSLSRNKEPNWLVCNGTPFDTEAYSELYEVMKDDCKVFGFDPYQQELAYLCPVKYRDRMIYIYYDTTENKNYIIPAEKEDIVPSVDSPERIDFTSFCNSDAVTKVRSSGLIELEGRLVAWSFYYPASDTKKQYLKLKYTTDLIVWTEAILDISSCSDKIASNSTALGNALNLVGIYKVGGQYLVLFNHYNHCYKFLVNNIFSTQTVSGIVRIDTYMSDYSSFSYRETSGRYIFIFRSTTVTRLDTTDYSTKQISMPELTSESGFFEISGEIYLAVRVYSSEKFRVYHFKDSGTSITQEVIFEDEKTDDGIVFATPDGSDAYFIFSGTRVYRITDGKVTKTEETIPFSIYYMDLNNRNISNPRCMPMQSCCIIDMKNKNLIAHGRANSKYIIGFRLPNYLPLLSAERGYVYIRAK